MIANTLFGRLLVASFIVLGVFFGLIAYTINQLSLENLHESKREQLRLQNYVLLTAAQIGESSIELPDELREPRFEEFESGLYGIISDSDGLSLWQSYSAHSLNVDAQLLQSKGQKPGHAEFQVTPTYFIYRHTVLWEIISDKPQLITFTVLEDKAPSIARINRFKQSIYLWLTVLGAMLICLLMFILRWGTKPLRDLAKHVKQIEQGEIEQLQGNYPVELRAVSTNLNQLIQSERLQRERYHKTLADLAHSLKTPLAVIQSELNKHTNSLISDQVSRMDDIVKHQLQRAVLTTPTNLTDTVPVLELVNRLVHAMNKVYAVKNLSISTDILENVVFRGDKRDLMEVLGNLIDNACKSAVRQIIVAAKLRQSILTIDIHDDGPGIDENKREQLIKRGQRADTRNAGQGIGLDVANDIIESYQGELSIGESHLGGALLHIELPQSSGNNDI